MNYQDVVVVETFEEAEQFRYEHNDEPVEIGTAVAYETIKRKSRNKAPWRPIEDKIVMTCFDGIYFQESE